MKEELSFKCLSVGMSGTRAIEQDPIQGKHLFVMPPGKTSMICLRYKVEAPVSGHPHEAEKLSTTGAGCFSGVIFVSEEFKRGFFNT